MCQIDGVLIPRIRRSTAAYPEIPLGGLRRNLRAEQTKPRRAPVLKQRLSPVFINIKKLTSRNLVARNQKCEPTRSVAARVPQQQLTDRSQTLNGDHRSWFYGTIMLLE